MDTSKYVAVVLDDTLSFNHHVDYVRIKVSKILGCLLDKTFTYTRSRLYKAMVLPVLDYCDAMRREC